MIMEKPNVSESYGRIIVEGLERFTALSARVGNKVITHQFGCLNAKNSGYKRMYLDWT